MPLLFSRLCDLFHDLELITQPDPPLLPTVVQQNSRARISQWIRSLDTRDTTTDIDRVALLSAIFPKKRTDRVYSLQADSLSKKLRRILCLGLGRWELLDQWKKPGRGDLGECVLRALKEAENPPTSKHVTVEEVDRILAGIAKGNRFSAPRVRNATIEEMDVDTGLKSLYLRMQSREAKWLTRMILKDYSPLDIPAALVYRCIDPQLPIMMKLHDNFEDAIKMLTDSGIDFDQSALKPQIGVKVGRPSYYPARGIKHAVQTIKGRKMSVEKKYDGEYCQIHVDLRNPNSPFQFFSKSGKDSTADRAGLHKTLRHCLRIGSEECVITEKCILEGEMVVWSDRNIGILDFCKIRKHVSRTGSFLGTSADSQPHPWEHLMIIIFDVLLLDDHSLLPVPHASRRKLLEQLITPIPGRAALAVQRELDFSKPRAPVELQKYFAQAIASRWEGLVLKPSDEPYFGPAKRVPNTYPSCWLKMKKDYIKGLGDTADFAVVGAGYDVQEASRRGDKRLNWTHFHIGCLKNKGAVVNLHAKPEYIVLDVVTHCVNPKDMTWLNQHGQFRALDIGSAECSDKYDFAMTPAITPKMSVAFRQPFVLEVLGGGFDRPPNADYFRLRWPRLVKIHQDRDWKDCITMEELQVKAQEALAVPVDEDLPEEIETWQTKLDAADRGKKGKRMTWDDSQYEESEDSEVETERSPTHAAPCSSNRARSKRSGAVPLVRKDTDEMSTGEQRLPTGEVTHRRTSQASMTSTASRSSLPTPPTSSPARKDPIVGLPNKPCPTGSPSLHRKRKSEVTAVDEVSTPTKRKRTKEKAVSCSRQLSEVPKTPAISKKRKSDVIAFDDDTSTPPKRQCSRDNTAVKPLCEIVNSASRSNLATSTRIEGRTTERFLVPKIPAMSDARFLPKARRQSWRPIVSPCSTPRETTASACSTQTTSVSSHQTIEHSNKSCSPQPKPPNINSPTASKNDAPTYKELPNLLHHRVMLSESVSLTQQTLIHDRIRTIIPQPTTTPTLSPSPAAFPPTPPPTNPSNPEEIILLIDPSPNEIPPNSLLLSTLTRSYHRLFGPSTSIAIWNSRILKLSPTASSPKTQQLYIGTMTLDAPRREVVSHWRTGSTTREPLVPCRVPNLLKYPSMLSLCVATNPEVYERYLAGRFGHLLQLPYPCVRGYVTNTMPVGAGVRKAVLMVDSFRMRESRECIEAVAGWLPGSGCERVEVWHWEILKIIEEREMDTRNGERMGFAGRDGEVGGKELEDRRRVEECYFGAIRLVDESKRSVEGDVKTYWPDGIATHYRVTEDGEVEVMGQSGL